MIHYSWQHPDSKTSSWLNFPNSMDSIKPDLKHKSAKTCDFNLKFLTSNPTKRTQVLFESFHEFVTTFRDSQVMNGCLLATRIYSPKKQH
jgi:hypothetical protein